MQHISTTPFGRRPVTAELIEAQALAHAPLPQEGPDKWSIFRDLTAGRVAFGISDRDLTVLSALLSFHQHASLAEGEGTIVFPSNAALAERAHGMAESTLRRHLGALVRARLILRHDSPNGKRYAARDAGGAVTRAFGFDLRPLLLRAGEIANAAREAKAAALRLKRLRETCVLQLRDAAKLIPFGRETVAANWDALEDRVRLSQRALRRKLDADALRDMVRDTAAVLRDVTALLESATPDCADQTEEMSGNDGANERHIQYSNRNLHDLEPSLEQEEAAGADALRPVDSTGETHGTGAVTGAPPKLPLFLVTKACPDLLDYVPQGIRSWYDLVEAADFVRPMLGISPDAWQSARDAMGPEVAAITLAAILQRADDIRSPGGYLRALTDKAAVGAFSPGPMIMALMNVEGRAA